VGWGTVTAGTPGWQTDRQTDRLIRQEPQQGPGKHSHGALWEEYFWILFFLKWRILVYFLFLSDGRPPKYRRVWSKLSSTPSDDPEIRLSDKQTKCSLYTETKQNVDVVSTYYSAIYLGSKLHKHTHKRIRDLFEYALYKFSLYFTLLT